MMNDYDIKADFWKPEDPEGTLWLVLLIVLMFVGLRSL